MPSPPVASAAGISPSGSVNEVGMGIFERHESRVRSYSRSFPTVFVEGRGCALYDHQGRRYLDFFAGAGALNYGHNPPDQKERLLAYLAADGVTHSLDLATRAKAALLERFQEVVLAPRGLDYRVQFPGPTGTNAVEAAMKLARKVTGRATVAHFANSFHGVTLGSLAVTGNRYFRQAAGIPLVHSVSWPFDGDGVADGLEGVAEMLENPGSGVETPAAVLVETVQAEGGVKLASAEWLRRLRQLTAERGILLIVDDIQVGCGRTGPFFSFEAAGITPDIVLLSKSISGYGLPLSMVLIAPHLDRWEPGEHIGTFRGNNLAFVTAAAALEHWRGDGLTATVEARGEQARVGVQAMVERVNAAFEGGFAWRGRGLIQGLVTPSGETARRISQGAFERGLIIETCGPRGEVVKLLPPLIVSGDEMDEGLGILAASLQAAAA